LSFTHFYRSATSHFSLLKGGDCDDRAILTLSMLKSIGIENTALLESRGCEHAFAGVKLTETDNLQDFNGLIKHINEQQTTGNNTDYFYYSDNGYWLIIDTAGSEYLGGILEGCGGASGYCTCLLPAFCNWKKI